MRYRWCCWQGRAVSPAKAPKGVDRAIVAAAVAAAGVDPARAGSSRARRRSSTCLPRPRPRRGTLGSAELLLPRRVASAGAASASQNSGNELDRVHCGEPAPSTVGRFGVPNPSRGRRPRRSASLVLLSRPQAQHCYHQIVRLGLAEAQGSPCRSSGRCRSAPAQSQSTTIPPAPNRDLAHPPASLETRPSSISPRAAPPPPPSSRAPSSSSELGGRPHSRRHPTRSTTSSTLLRTHERGRW